MTNIYCSKLIKNNIHDILFAEDFDEHIIEKRATQKSENSPEKIQSIELTFSFDEIEKAKNQSYADGIRAGEDKIESRLSISAIKTFSLIDQILSEIEKNSIIHLQQTSNYISELLFSTLSAILPKICTYHQSAEIVGVVTDVMANMTNEFVLCVSVAPEMIDQLRAALSILSPEKSRRVAIVTSADLDPGDAKISWQDGAASYSNRRAQNTVTSVLTALNLLPHSPPIRNKINHIYSGASPITKSIRAQQKVETTNA